MVDSFSLPSGLKINFEKFEVLFLANGEKPKKETVISLGSNRNFTVKKAISSVFFSSVFICLGSLEKVKILMRLNSWNWRNLMVLERIQIIK